MADKLNIALTKLTATYAAADAVARAAFAAADAAARATTASGYAVSTNGYVHNL